MLNLTKLYLRKIVAQHPSLYLPLKNLQGKYGIVNLFSEIVIEGYPRCANSFAEAAFRVAQNREINIGHHTHAPAQVLAAVEMGIPVIVVFRDPDDAVASRIMRNEKISFDFAYREYVWFYESIWHVLDKCVLSNFERTTNNFCSVIQDVNSKFHTSFFEFDDSDPKMVKQTYELIDTLSEQRIGRKTNYTNFLSNTSEKFATIHVSSHSEQKQKLKKNIQVQTSTKIRKGSPEQIRNVTTLMDRGGVQQAMKKVVADCGIKKKFLTNKDRSWLGYRLARSILVR